MSTATSTAAGASASAAPATAATAPPLSEQEILSTYRKMQSEMQNLIQTLTKVEMERNEHRLVEETLEPLDPDRRAFRLVGGVLVRHLWVWGAGGHPCRLCFPFEFDDSSMQISHRRASYPPQVERTVREVLPTVKEHRGNLDVFVQNLKDKLDTTQKEAAAWKAKYNLRTQEEIEAANRRQ
ncbi:hypothetical protein ACHAWU_007830 [Discostella pseudostelligera]|uniref:Prefoldin subunit 2 n=1 Tax=Discostella pseudostelligera TaxID=259834 RepID=A0ABD3N5E6_9STRA